jgi:signal transduction histidine kinase
LESVQKQLIELEETAVQTHREMRLLLHELRPTNLQEKGLEEALRQRLQMVEFRSGIRGQISAILPIKLPFSVEEVLFQVANEALNNTLKHSQADMVLINIAADGSHVNMRIRDNGRGFSTDGTDFSAGMGLDIMRQRVEEMGGTFHHESQPDAGTTVVAHIPLVPEGFTGVV